jgi:hypothetical protein
MGVWFQQPPRTKDIQHCRALSHTASGHLVEPALVATRGAAGALGDAQHGAEGSAFELVAQGAEATGREHGQDESVELQGVLVDPVPALA